ncbi:GspE/PulE family protein [Sinimarinibacterium sp. NLF-5-8]|uniref:GspE/PulE family protein n=1 Tax=Sinimarinibacterium sp. NLF-5-8 TaxID=2698684 RepID=UPI00137C1440|nr:ATPase, T2SS/T4P/T4SS family [Sinimarinibacterium sp. NLF-5-8]QHS09130.1 hypothetical protein GT972_02485 [Sinimarinibacterium sp. NLF-5-8]
MDLTAEIAEQAFLYAHRRWGIKPGRALVEHAALCMRFEGQRCADIAEKMGWVDSVAASDVRRQMPAATNHLREVEALVAVVPNLDRHRQRLFAIAESLIWLDVLSEEGVCAHAAMDDVAILNACEKHGAALIDINGTPALAFYEREAGMRRYQQISGVDRAFDPIRRQFPKIEFALTRNDEVIGLLDKKLKAHVQESPVHAVSDHQNSVIYASELMQESDALRKLAIMHDMGLTHAASDIHLWMNNDGRPFCAYRVLGDLAPMPIKLTAADYLTILNYLLRRSGAAIKYERMREPKDGMYQFIGTVSSKKANVRCSFIPNSHSDTPERQLISMCLRLIPEETGSVVLEEKGVRDDVIKYIRRAIIPDSGIVLLVGPTGSGKSTTIAGAVDLHRKLHGDTKVRLSIEDPVERFYPGIEQFQVPYHLRGTSTGFSLFLRNFLRHDPNLIWLGEIRDDETAKVAVQAASTGHLVISTLHADSTSKTVQRLTDMIPPQDRAMRAALIDNLSLIVAQRLVKKLCPECSTWGNPTEREREHVDYLNEMKGIHLTVPDRVKSRHGAGCKYCNYTGYAGRLPVNEVLEFTDEVKFIFRDPDPVAQARKIKQALRLSMEDCIMDAVNQGATALASLEI